MTNFDINSLELVPMDNDSKFNAEVGTTTFFNDAKLVRSGADAENYKWSDQTKRSVR